MIQKSFYAINAEIVQRYVHAAQNLLRFSVRSVLIYTPHTAGLQDLHGWLADAKSLPILIGAPALIILVLWVLSGAAHIPSVEVFARNGYTQFFGHWDFKWYPKNPFFIVSIMVPAAGLAVYSVYRGVHEMWRRMSKRANIKTEYRPSVGMFFKEFLWPSLVEAMKHNRFRECTANTQRVKGHLPLVLGFIGAFILTCWSAFRQDLMGLIWPSFHGPLPLTDPFKTLANISAIALLYGVWVLASDRIKLEKRGKASRTFYDWFLIWEIAAVGITGLLAELLRWAGMPTLGYLIYFLHLVSVLMLFLYMPYTKFAHIVYRTTAMCFEKFRESGFARNQLFERERVTLPSKSRIPVTLQRQLEDNKIR